MPLSFRHLRIVGFKSFVEPVTVEIGAGLNGIVGPNGCGKSNIVEALRWAMGENSAKSMRGGEMEDVIFAGTEKRPARALAEVSIRIENADQSAPHPLSEAPEIEIVRRIETRHPGIPVIGFPKGAGVHYREYAMLTGVDAIGLDSTVPLDWAQSVLQKDAVLQGNLDPIFLVIGGAAMEQAAKRILETLGDGPFVFNLGHGIRPETPIAHVERLCEMIRHWRAT